jgi:D-alanine transaminase
MPRLAYVNGRYLPHRQGAVHIEDRGFQFADGVYEVVPVYQGVLIDEEPHLDRLERSLRELRIPMPAARATIKLIARELIRRNDLTTGLVYMQVTRGAARRDHSFPANVSPTLVMTTRQSKPHRAAMLSDGVSVITAPDIRWRRCDIKSVALLPNVLVKQKAAEAGAYEAWQVDEEGRVTEGSSTNAWIVTQDNTVVTRDASQAILNGITRLSLLKVIRAAGYHFAERPFTVTEAKAAREAFLTSSTSYVLPVTRIDGVPVGDGRPGALTMALRQHYMTYMAEHKMAQARLGA